MSYKVFHFVSSLNVGGAERFSLDLAITQRGIGHDVEIISTGALDDLLVREAGILQIPINIMPAGRVNSYQKILTLLRTSGKRILHIHSPHVLLFIGPILLLLKLYGVKIVYTRHGSDPLTKLKWFLSHRWARYFISETTFVSQAGLEVFHKNHHWPKASLKMIKNGVFIPNLLEHSLEKKSINQKSLRIGSVGRLVSIKAQLHLLKAISKLSSVEKNQVEIHIYGDGPDKEMLVDYSNRSLSDVPVFFYGMILDREVIFSSIDLLIMCSETEGLSMSIMEAMAREVPVVATDVGDSAKLVLPERTGSLYNFGDVDDLARLIKFYLANDQRRVEQSKNAKNHIRDNYSILETAKLYDQCYG